MNFTGDPTLIRWSIYAQQHCSYCGAEIDDDDCPLRLFRENSELGAVFCDDCAENYFGVKFFREGVQDPAKLP